jgi:parallel beta-helix repeat protein
MAPRSAPVNPPAPTPPSLGPRDAPSEDRHTRRSSAYRRIRLSTLAVAGLVAASLAGGYWISAPAAAPPVGSTFVSDNMARNVTGGWGEASLGGSYSVIHPQASSMDAGVGALTVATSGSSNAAILPEATALDGDVQTTMSLPGLPEGGGGVYSSILLRRQADSDAYHAKIRVRPRGEVWLSFSRTVDGVEAFLGPEQDGGIVLAPGQPLNVEAEVVGTESVLLRSRVWLGSAPPPEWQHEVTDSAAERITRAGAVGVMVYLSESTSAPVTVGFAGLTARAPPTSNAADAPGAAAPHEGLTAEPRGADGAASGVESSGSSPLGSTTYPVPDDAVVVSPSGDDDASGTLADPVRTVGRAISIALSGATIVLRGGAYHEKVEIPADKRLTLQSYPNEQVWFDGSSVVRGWAPSGSTWVKDGWTKQFDSTPCYNAGTCNMADADFQFVDDASPMAAHPDQVWIDDEPLQQVASVEQVTADSFFVDYSADRLYIGRDPAGREVRASDLVDAIAIRSNGSVVRGIGVHRYATPLPEIATVKADAEDVTLENMVVSDNATAGVSITQANCTVRNVSSVRNGMLGFHVSYADGTTLSEVLAEGNNTEHFKQAPVAGGIKIGRSRGVSAADSAFVANEGTGIWFDESSYGITVRGSSISGNSGHGISLELSAKAVVVDNLVVGNGQDGLKINNTESVQVWNNTFVGNNRTVWVVQDERLASDLSNTGHDPRQHLPDPTVTWLSGAVTISNNIFSRPASGSPCVLCVEDMTEQRSASEMQIVANGNVYNRTSSSSPAQLIVWSSGPGDPEQFSTVTEFSSATGQERASLVVDGSPFVTDDGTIVGSMPAGIAQPLPDAIAARSGHLAGTRHLGAWKN